MSKDIEKQLNQILTRLDNVDDQLIDLSDRLTNVEQSRSRKSLFQSAITPPHWLTIHDPQNGDKNNLRIANRVKPNADSPYTSKIAQVTANITKREFAVITTRDQALGLGVGGFLSSGIATFLLEWPWHTPFTTGTIVGVIGYALLVLQHRHLVHQTVAAASNNGHGHQQHASVVLTITQENLDGHPIVKKLIDIPGTDLDRLIVYSRGLIKGHDMATRTWIPEKDKLFSSTQYKSITSTLRLNGCASKPVGNQPSELTDFGKRLMTRLSKLKPTDKANILMKRMAIEWH